MTHHVDGEPDTCVHGVKLDTEFCSECFRSSLNAADLARYGVPREATKASEQTIPFTVLNDDEAAVARERARAKLDKAVNCPPHYTVGSIECIDAMVSVYGIEAVQSFCVMNAFKYIWRFDRKGGEQDLKKAIWYLRFATGDDPRREG